VHTSAYVSIRQHTSAYVRIRPPDLSSKKLLSETRACASIRQHTSAYVSIRQHTSAYVRRTSAQKSCSRRHVRLDLPAGNGAREVCATQRARAAAAARLSACVSMRQHISAYVSMRQHTSAYVSIEKCVRHSVRELRQQRACQHASAYVSIRQHREVCATQRARAAAATATAQRFFLFFAVGVAPAATRTRSPVSKKASVKAYVKALLRLY
jgi:hypothetical protein